MKTRAFIATLLCMTALFASTSTSGATEFGARAFGMGGAYTALSDDIAAIMYNPAGLPSAGFQVGLGLGSNDLSAVTQFQSLLSDPSTFSDDASVDLTTLSGVSINGFGVGIAADGDLDVSTECGALLELCADGEYMTQLVFGLGRDTASLPLHIPGLHAGFNVKRLDGRRIQYQESVASDGVFASETEEWRGQGYSVGIGAQFKATDIITVGIAANDVVSSLTWRGTRTTSIHNVADDTTTVNTEEDLGTTEETLTPSYRVGVAVKPPILGMTLSADAGSDGSIRYGLEKNLLFNALSLRLGGIREGDTTTTTAGVGVNLGPFSINAAAGSSDGFETMTTMLEGSVRF